MFARLLDKCEIKMNVKGVTYPEIAYEDLDLGDKMWVVTPLFNKNIFVKGNPKDDKYVSDIKILCNESGVVVVK